MKIQKAIEQIQQEFLLNQEKSVQAISNLPALQYYEKALADNFKIMALSDDLIFLGLPTGELQIINPIEPQNNFLQKAHDGGIEKVLVTKTNTIVVTSSSIEINVWELIKPQQYIEIVSIAIKENEANLIALSEEGYILAYTGSNKKLKILRIKEDESQQIKEINLSEELQYICLSQDGKMLAGTSQKQSVIIVSVWNMDLLKIEFTQTFNINQLDNYQQKPFEEVEEEKSHEILNCTCIKKIIYCEGKFILITSTGTIYKLDKQFCSVNKKNTLENPQKLEVEQTIQEDQKSQQYEKKNCFNYLKWILLPVLILLIWTLLKDLLSVYSNEWFNKVIIFHNQIKQENELKYYDEVIILDPKDKKAWFKKGIAFDNQGKYEDALKCYDQAIKLDSKYANAWNNKGIAFYNQGKYEDALKCYDEVIKLDPKDKTAWFNKGIALDDQAKYEDSLKCYDEAIKLDPKFAYAWNNKGIAFKNQGKYKDALKCYDQAIKLDPKYANAWNNKGIAFYNQGKYEDAVKCYDEAIKLDSKYNEAWNNKGIALDDLKKYEDALNCYDEAIKLDPNDKLSQNNKQITLNKLKGFKK